MISWRDQITEALRDSVTVAALAGCPIPWQDITIEYHDAAHKPPTLLPTGKMAIYGFCWNDVWLKIGIAGPQSQARYTSQHYNAASAPSTLAASLQRDANMKNVTQFDADNAGDWIKNYCCRVNILIPASYGRAILALLEAFLHVKLKPRYER